MDYKNYKNKIISLTLLSGILLAGCSLPAPTTPAKIQTQSTNTQESKNVYVSEKYDFKVEYPSSWKLFNQEGLIFTANDEPDQEPWRGTNLNIQTEYTSGDVGMGWKTIKEKKYVNSNGAVFELSFYEFDESFDPAEKLSKEQKADRMVTIGTDLIPGLVMFNYNETVNPKGEEQLNQILEGITKKN